jgi:signal transduction histidine kinase
MVVKNYLLSEMENIRGEDCLVFIFTSKVDKVREILREVNLKFQNSFVVLSTTDGEIYNGRIINDTVITVIKFEKTNIEVYYHYDEDSYKMGKELALKFSEKPDLIIGIGDGMYTNGEEFLNGIYSVYDNVVVSGGLAADNGEMKQTFIGLNDKIYSKGAILIGLFNKDLIVETYNSLGWQPIGDAHIITKANKDKIYEINNKTVVDFYTKYLGKEVANVLPKIGVEFPLLKKSGDKLVARAILRKLENGGFKLGGSVEEGEKVYLGIGMLDNILKVHIKNLNIKKPELFLIFSCMVRKRFLRENIVYEIEQFANAAFTSGFFTHGEFYNSSFENETLNVVSISEKLNDENKECGYEMYINLENDNFLAYLNVIKNLALEYEKKEKNIQKLERYLKIKTELLNRVEAIEKISTFEIDIKELKEKGGINCLTKSDFFRFVNKENLKKLIEFFKSLKIDGFIEINSKDKRFLIFAKKNEGKIYGIAVDITEIRKKDEMLMAQSRLAQMGEMINMIAHQWRQPLNAVSAAIIKIQLMSELDALNKEELNNTLKLMSEILQNISKTIDEFLHFSKPVSKCEKINSIDIIDNIMKIVLVQLQNHNIQVDLQINDFEIKSYKKEIEHILLNLITNARDVLDKKEGRKELIIRVYKNAEKVIFEVEDNGGGVKVKPLEKVFEPYFTQKENGTGLGLYMSKKIAIQKLKGDLIVENTAKGALFRLIIKDICGI